MTDLPTPETDAATVRDYFEEDGAPKKCPKCDSEKITEKIIGVVDVFQGMGPTCEAEYYCECGECVGFWAYGAWYPQYRESFLANPNHTLKAVTERPTPETDSATLRAHDIYCGGDFDAVDAELSKKLERERDEARESLELYKAANSDVKRIARERDEARAEINKLKVENDHNWQANEFAEEAFKERDEARSEINRIRDFMDYGFKKAKAELADERELADRLANAVACLSAETIQGYEHIQAAFKAWKEARK